MAVDAFIWFRQSGALTCSIGGKNIHLMVRPGGAAPPPGDFVIHPPLQDPIYGMVALMVPVAPQGSQVGKEFDKEGPRASFTIAPPGLAPQWSFFAPVGKWMPFPSQASPVFVISDKPIPGRNCIVVSVGFADLMEALQGGGATIKVI